MVEFINTNEAIIRLSIFLGAFILLAFCESYWPKRSLTQSRVKRWLNNFLLLATGTLVVRIVMPIVAVGAAYFAEQQHLGFANHFELPLWLVTLTTFILLDFSIYLQHVIFHVMPLLWRFHRVHHSDMDADVSTGLRFHPLEILISILFKVALIMILGAPVLAVILFEVVLNFMSMFTHSNIRLNEKLERVLRWFIVTPDMHRIHHSAQENETNSNFSFHISVWDRIFGTYKEAPEAGHARMTIGLDQFREDEWQNYGGLLMMPFSSSMRGYAINYRDTQNARELAQAKEIAARNKEKAELATELNSYIQAIGQHALVSMTDAAGTIIEVNDKFCEVSGYSSKELLGQNHRIINSGMHDSGFFKEMWATISSGEEWHGEVCNRTKNGSLYWVDSAIVPIKNADGKIERYISVRVDITQRKKYELGIERANRELTDANAELEELSRIDALTGIANRRCFDQCLTENIAALQKKGELLTLLLCDVDHFKNYNDAYGHRAGDSCLRKVAKTMTASFTRVDDLVARYGGEEFAVILPGVNKETAMLLSERMRASIADRQIMHENSPVADVVTVSIGAVSQVPGEHMGAQQFVEKADDALYRAKSLGRNRVEFSE